MNRTIPSDVEVNNARSELQRLEQAIEISAQASQRYKDEIGHAVVARGLTNLGEVPALAQAHKQLIADSRGILRQLRGMVEDNPGTVMQRAESYYQALTAARLEVDAALPDLL